MSVLNGVFKNIEVFLMLSFGLVCAAALWSRAPAAGSGVETRAGPALAAPMPVVVVTAKRMTAAQKRDFANLAPENRGG